MEIEWLDERAVAALLGVHPHTVRRWRRAGVGPKYRRIGPRLIRYRRQDVDAYADRGGQDAA